MEKNQIKINGIEYDVYTQKESSSDEYLLFIPGFQDMVLSAEHLFKDSGLNVITFDLPLTYTNTNYKKDLKHFSYEEELLNIIKVIGDRYKIEGVMSVSITTSFLMKNVEKIKEYTNAKHILIGSPQILPDPMDVLLGFLMRIFLLIEKAGISIYSNFINIPFIRNVWVGIITGNSTNETTLEIKNKDLVNAKGVGFPLSFIQFTKLKRNFYRDVLSKGSYMTHKNINFLYGVDDNMLNIDQFRSILKSNGFDDKVVYSIESNHILEIEGKEKTNEILKSILKSKFKRKISYHILKLISKF